MGYSLAPAPDTHVPNLPRNNRVVSPSISKDKLFQPREELVPISSRTGEEVTEIVSFLNNVEPPKQPESHLYSTNSKLKRSTLGTLLKIGRFSTKRQEQLRAALPKPTRDEESIAGAKYLHIAVDQSAFKSSANFSMYRANDYRDPAQKRMTASYSPTVPGETPAASEEVGSLIGTPTIPKSQSFQLSDALGISKEYPHLISGEPKTSAGPKPGKDGPNIVSSSDTLVPRHDSDKPKTQDFAIHSSNVRFELIHAEPLRGRELVSSTGSANSSVLDLTALPFRTSSKSLRRTSNKQSGPIAIEVVTETPQPSPRSARSSRSPPGLSRQSVPSVSDGLPTPLPRESQSTRSSMQSASESLDILSDTSSGIVLSAQSAECMRPEGLPGSHSSAAMRKPPKPGPAPTRALPSLPEGQDGITMIHRPSVDTRSSPLRIEPSPERPLPMKFPSPPKSPPKNQRHSHQDVADKNVAKATAALIKSATAPQPHWPRSSNPPFSPTIKRNSLQPSDSLSTISMNAETLLAWRRRRATATKALKRRDLERGRARRASRKSFDLITTIDPADPTEPDPAPSTSKHTDTPREDPSSSASDDDNTRPPFTTSSHRRQDPAIHHHRHSTNVSPIMLVAAQSPDASPKRTSRLSDDAAHDSTAANTTSAPELERGIPTSSADLERENPNGSSEPEQANPNRSPNHTREPELQPPTPPHPAPSPSPNEAPPSRSPSGSRTATTIAPEPMRRHDGREYKGRMKSGALEELEARMEARLAAMERKNALLEAALLAVINTSAGFAARGRVLESVVGRGGEGLEGLVEGLGAV